MEYAKTKDILYVMKMLGHRDIKTTLMYTQLVSFESDEFHSATSKTIEEAGNSRSRLRIRMHIQRHNAVSETQVKESLVNAPKDQ